MLLVMFASPPPRAALRCSHRWRRGAARPRPLAALYAWLVRSSRPTTLALHAIVYELPADLVDSLEAAVEDSLHIWSVIDTIDTTDTIDTSSTLRHFDTRHTRHVDTVRASILSRSPSTLRRHSRHLDTGVNRHPLDTHSTLTRHSPDTVDTVDTSTHQGSICNSPPVRPSLPSRPAPARRTAHHVRARPLSGCRSSSFIR